MMNKKLLLAFLLTLTCGAAWADDIEVPEEELARESVLPVFDRPQSVRARKIKTNQKLEIGAGMALEMNEPYYSDYTLNAVGTYHFDERQALNVLGIFWADGLSAYGEQLKAGGSGSNKFNPFDASLAPHPKWSLIGNYEFVAYYGKISLSKRSVMHLNLFGVGGLGYMSMGETNSIVLNGGIGQNFYFTKNFAIRFDIRCLIFRGPNPASQILNPSKAAPAVGSFDQRVFFNTQFAAAAVFIL